MSNERMCKMNEAQIMVNELVTPREAAEMLDYSPRQVYRFIRSNQLKSLALWGKSFVLESELDRFRTEITQRR